jgi:hypothetical protein
MSENFTEAKSGIEKMNIEEISTININRRESSMVVIDEGKTKSQNEV